MARRLAIPLLLAALAAPSQQARAQAPGRTPGAKPAAAKPAAAKPAGAAAEKPVVPTMGAIKSVHRLSPPLGCDRLTIADGLPSSNVPAIIQDLRGFIWLGTQDGLVRYDGLQMKVYRPVDDDPASISSGYITALALDATGKLWVGTAEHGVNLYDPETDRFTRYSRRTGATTLTSEGVTSIVRDRKDRIWLALSGGGLARFEATSGSFTPFQQKPLDATITALEVDASGALWLGTANEGIMRWDPDAGGGRVDRPTLDEDHGIAQVTALRATKRGKLWIGTEGDGLFELDPKTGRVVRHRSVADDPTTPSDDRITSLFEDRSEHLWIGTTNGLDRRDPKGKWVRFQHDRTNPTSLAFNGVESVYQDAAGVMWVGGFTVGVCKFHDLRLRFAHHYIPNHTTRFLEDSDGALWVGTYNEGLRKYERGTQRLTVYHGLRGGEGPDAGGFSFESGAWILALHRDRRGTLWIAVRGRGLIALDTKAETYRRYAPDPDDPGSLPADTIFDIREDDQGALWLATWGSGLIRFDPALGSFTSYTSDGDDGSGLSSNHLYTLYPDPTDKKVLWIGTARGGVVRFNTAAGTATAFRHRPEDPTSISHDDVMSIYRDPSGSVWIGTYGGGLNRLDPATGRAERFTTANSRIPHNMIIGLLPDDDGKLWMSTNNAGLAQFDPKTGACVVYNSADGAQDNEFSQGGFLRGKSGELFFGGASGFNAFAPREIQRDPYVPPVVVTAFKLFNQDVKLDRPIWTLPPLQVSYADSFEVQFAALAFAAPGRNRYAYKLEGFDDNFIETDRPYATYTKLGGGKYTLKIRAANRHGVWNEAGVALEIEAEPPLWRTKRAYGVYMLLLAGLLYLIFYLQQQRVKRAEREGRLAVVERDLELTGAVQTGFLPEDNEVAAPYLRLFGFYRPADACSGDWWWHEALSGGRRLILVGDVTGHGPGPAMVTAAVATAFRVLMEHGLEDVQEALEMLNREVLRVAKGKYHMTMAALEIHEESGRWIFRNAGAPPILSLGSSGKHRVHFCAGAPLGTETGFEVGEAEGQLAPGERLLLYTDGIPEIELPNGSAFGMRRFAQLYEYTRTQGLRDAASTILLQADQGLAGQRQSDDWTFVIVEWGMSDVPLGPDVGEPTAEPAVELPPES